MQHQERLGFVRAFERVVENQQGDERREEGGEESRAGRGRGPAEDEDEMVG